MNIRRSNTEKRGIVDLSAKPTPEQLQNDIKLMRMQIEKEKTAKELSQFKNGGKNPELRLAPEGSFTSFPEEGLPDVQKLLEMLANYDQNAPIGEFIETIQEGLVAGPAALVGSMGTGAAKSAMQNLPPRDVESLLMELQQQGR